MGGSGARRILLPDRARSGILPAAINPIRGNRPWVTSTKTSTSTPHRSRTSADPAAGWVAAAASPSAGAGSGSSASSSCCSSAGTPSAAGPASDRSTASTTRPPAAPSSPDRVAAPARWRRNARPAPMRTPRRTAGSSGTSTASSATGGTSTSGEAAVPAGAHQVLHRDDQHGLWRRKRGSRPVLLPDRPAVYIDLGFYDDLRDKLRGERRAVRRGLRHRARVRPPRAEPGRHSTRSAEPAGPAIAGGACRAPSRLLRRRLGAQRLRPVTSPASPTGDRRRTRRRRRRRRRPHPGEHPGAGGPRGGGAGCLPRAPTVFHGDSTLRTPSPVTRVGGRADAVPLPSCRGAGGEMRSTTSSAHSHPSRRAPRTAPR